VDLGAGDEVGPVSGVLTRITLQTLVTGSYGTFDVGLSGTLLITGSPAEIIPLDAVLDAQVNVGQPTGDCPAAPLLPASDGDGFSNFVEIFMGTDPLDACPDDPSDDAWPPDINMDTRANVLDLMRFKKPVILSCSDDPSYDTRFDFDANGCINILDVMMYKPFILTQCVNP